MADAPLLSLRNVSKSFGGIHAVHDISFDVGAGESVYTLPLELQAHL